MGPKPRTRRRVWLVSAVLLLALVALPLVVIGPSTILTGVSAQEIALCEKLRDRAFEAAAEKSDLALLAELSALVPLGRIASLEVRVGAQVSHSYRTPVRFSRIRARRFSGLSTRWGPDTEAGRVEIEPTENERGYAGIEEEIFAQQGAALFGDALRDDGFLRLEALADGAPAVWYLWTDPQGTREFELILLDEGH